MASKILHSKLTELWGEDFQVKLRKIRVWWLLEIWDGVFSSRDAEFDKYLAELIGVPLEELVK
jgi:hypothetical protein